MNNLNIVSLKQTLNSLVETDCIITSSKSKLLQEISVASSEEQFQNILSSLHENKDMTYRYLSFDDKRNLTLENFDKEDNNYNKYNVIEQYAKISDYLLREDNNFYPKTFADQLKFNKLSPENQALVRKNPDLILGKRGAEPPKPGALNSTSDYFGGIKDFWWKDVLGFGKHKSQDPVTQKPQDPKKSFFNKDLLQKAKDRLLPAAGILGVTFLIYKLFNTYLSKAAQACSSLQGLNKEECMTNFKVKATEEAINRLNSAIQQCSQSPNSLNCSYSLHKQLRSWQDKLAIYQQQLQRIEAKKQEMNLITKTREQYSAPVTKRPRKRPSVTTNPKIKPKTFQEPLPVGPTDFGSGGF